MTLAQQIGKIVDDKLRALKLDSKKNTSISGDNWNDGTQKVKVINGLSGTVTITAGSNISVTIDGQDIVITGTPAENGVPPGGTTNQLLAKNSDADYDMKFVDAPEAANGLPAGGATGQIPAKIDGTDFNVQWVDAPSGNAITTTRVIRSSAFDVGVNTWIPVQWNVEVFDDKNAFDPASNTRITIPAGVGKIQIKCYIVWSNISSGNRYISIRKNGTDTIQVAIQPSANESGQTIDTGWISCSEGDYYEVVANSGSSGADVQGTSSWGGGSWFEIMFA